MEEPTSGWLDDADEDISVKPGLGDGPMRKLTESGKQKGRLRLVSIGTLGRGL